VKLGIVLEPFAIDSHLPKVCALLKDRCDTTIALAQWAARFYADVTPDAAELAQHVTDAVRPAIASLAEKLRACHWDKASIAAAIKEVLSANSMKMPQLAMPVRVLVMGTAQTPSLDSVLEMCGREKVIARLVGSK
jgi:glutamyl-tRNA synthetase